MWQLLFVVFFLFLIEGESNEFSFRRRQLLGAQYTVTSTNTSLYEINYMVAMRDGILLATDIYRFNDSNAYPVMLARTPYNKSIVDASLTRVDPAASGYPVTNILQAANYWNSRGYIIIEQDVRGQYNSEGVFTKYRNEANDGYDTVAWIKSQPWCNGKIGMFGVSYVAHTQAAALNANASLTTVVLDCGGFSDSYQGGIRQGGTFEGKQCTWAFGQALVGEAANTTIENALLNISLIDWFQAAVMPWTYQKSPLTIVPEYEDYILGDWQNSTFSDAYWNNPGIYGKGYWATRPDIPLITVSGWYDVYSRTAVENFVGLQNAGKKAPSNLLIGPWIHGSARSSACGNVSFGINGSYQASYTYYATWLQWWFDFYLQDKSTPVTEYPPVRIFIMGGGTGEVNATTGQVNHGGYWRDEKNWPLPDTVYTALYFWSDGSLQPKTQPTQFNRTFVYSPFDPNPSIGGAITSGAPLMVGGPLNQVTWPTLYPFPATGGQRLRDRSDVVYWQTDVLTQPLEVTGSIDVYLWISSNCTDTDFTAKIVDVYPDGNYSLGTSHWPMGNWSFFDMNIQDGILRTRYRNQTWSDPQLLTPNQIYPIVVQLFPTSNTFAVGHRLRVDISSSNFPKYDLNPNTGEWNGESFRNENASNTVWGGGVTPSYVLLPIINRLSSEGFHSSPSSLVFMLLLVSVFKSLL